jgi:hypothetical protein
MNPKLIFMLIAIGLTFLFGYSIKDKRKRILVIMSVLLVLSMASNCSIFWILYWDGLHYGRVVDADTGGPIEGASVAGIWTFEYNLIITGEDGFANARETVTDDQGAFVLPPIVAFSFWPIANLESMELIVFKPGYDSHPPVIRRNMEKPETAPFPTRDGKYHVGEFVHCKAWRECEVRLNKAINIKEEIGAYNECKSSLSAMNVNQHKVSNFIEVIKKPKFKYLEKKN